MSNPDDFKAAIRRYLEVSDALLRRELDEGLITITEAKRDTAEMNKWRELLEVLEATDILYGYRREKEYLR